MRAKSSRHYIDGGKSICDLYRDYVNECKSPPEGNECPYGNYVMYHRIFTQEFNLSFFTPKKDQCELCQAFSTVEDADKEKLKEQYDNHIEKDLSCIEKGKGKEQVNDKFIVACYHLQVMLPCPKGEVHFIINQN